jgi:hypothetical protein
MWRCSILATKLTSWAAQKACSVISLSVEASLFLDSDYNKVRVVVFSKLHWSWRPLFYSILVHQCVELRKIPVKDFLSFTSSHMIDYLSYIVSVGQSVLVALLTFHITGLLVFNVAHGKYCYVCNRSAVSWSIKSVYSVKFLFYNAL